MTFLIGLHDISRLIENVSKDLIVNTLGQDSYPLVKIFPNLICSIVFLNDSHKSSLYKLQRESEKYEVDLLLNLCNDPLPGSLTRIRSF